MTTYNTYTEAKIANKDKDKDIYELDGRFKAVDNAPTSHFANGWTKCNPADHCMSLKAFFEAGHKLVNGDLATNSEGRVSKVGVADSVDTYNTPDSDVDGIIFVLSAKALNDQAIEDFYDPEFEQVEWNGEGLPPVGFECEFISIGFNCNDGYQWCRFLGLLSDGSYAIEFHHNTAPDRVTCDCFDPELTNFRKPETQEKKKEHEEKEAFIKKAREVILYTGNTDVVCKFASIHPNNPKCAIVWEDDVDINLSCVSLDCLSKPETQEKKKERELLDKTALEIAEKIMAFIKSKVK